MKHLFKFKPTDTECMLCRREHLAYVNLANNPHLTIAFFCDACGYIDACMDCGVPSGAIHKVDCDLLETLEPGSPTEEQWYMYLKKKGLIV